MRKCGMKGSAGARRAGARTGLLMLAAATLLLAPLLTGCAKKGKVPVADTGPVRIVVLPFEVPEDDPELRWAAMAAVLGSLRRDPPEDFAGSPVESFIDYMHHDTGLPRSEVLRYTMANGAGLIARPSGTEPKLKVYLSAKEKSKEASLAATQKMKDEISEYIGKNNA